MTTTTTAEKLQDGRIKITRIQEGVGGNKNITEEIMEKDVLLSRLYMQRNSDAALITERTQALIDLDGLIAEVVAL